MAGARGSRSLLWLGIGGVAFAATFAAAQAPQTVVKKTSAHRANEFTLAGLRPGKDTASRAIQLYNKPTNKPGTQSEQMVWATTCQTQSLSIDLDSAKRIQVIRTVETESSSADCGNRSAEPWKTGRGLRVGDPIAKIAQLYGEPDSKSPSTRDGHPLELWYYAFDWAGPDVPQVMEVLCTGEKTGRPRRVVEITLAAPSL